MAFQVKHTHTTMQTAVLLLAAVASTLFFFRTDILGGFNNLMSDRHDGVIEISILEHWYNFLRGLEPWATTKYFFPYQYNLAYNDGYFLYGVIFSFFRFLGINPFIASELVNSVVKNIGFYGCYMVAHKILKIEFKWAVLAAVLFSISNNSFIQSGHAQLLGIGFAPVLVLFIDNALHALRRNDGRNIIIWGTVSALYYVAWLLTGFYMSWFFTFYCLVFICVCAIIVKPNFHEITKNIKTNIIPLLIVVAILFAALLPFVELYLPKVYETEKMRGDGFNSTPAIWDIVNVSFGNFLFGHTIEKFVEWWRPQSLISMEGVSERASGVPPILLGCFVFAMVAMRKKMRNENILMWCIAWTAIIIWLCTIHWATHHPQSGMWHYIYQYVPGAAGVRIVARYQIFLTLPLIWTAMYGLSCCRNMSRIMLTFLCFFLVAEEYDTNSPGGNDPRLEMSRLHMLSPVPPDCHSFYVTATRDGIGARDDNYNVDAMLIAETIHMPTINGVSTYNPPDIKFKGPATPGYFDEIVTYAKNHDIKGLCGLDLLNLKWSNSS